jgi:ribulose-phosphate 3-epimerase
MKLFLSLMGIATDQFRMIVTNFDSLVDGYHLDIMDGLFVPSKSLSTNIIYNDIKSLTQKPLWLHLMTINPLKDLDTIGDLHQTTVSFHIEIKQKIPEIIFVIQKKYGRPSPTINPKTSIFDLEPFLNQSDHITVMSVNPGASGQKFIPESIQRIETVKHFCNTYHKQITFGCDGGINETNITAIKAKGIAEAVLSSAVFRHKKITQQIKALELIRSLI